jgi:UDPglucose 6-dehydrogenase
MARTLNTRAEITETTDKVNRAMADKITEKLRFILERGATVAVLGLAYKPNSHVVEESQGVYLAKSLSESGARVVAYDPLANESANAELHGKIVILDSVAECLEQADIVLVTTADDEFKTLSAENFKNSGKPVIVYDFWRILKNSLSNQKNIEYIPVGCSRDEEYQGKFLSELWGNEEKILYKS